MGMRHKSVYGGYEYIDSPVPDCGCKVCQKLIDRQEGRGRSRRSSAIKSAWVTGEIIGTVVSSTMGVGAPPGQGAEIDEGWAKSNLHSRQERQSGDTHDATRDKGNRTGGTSQNG